MKFTKSRKGSKIYEIGGKWPSYNIFFSRITKISKKNIIGDTNWCQKHFLFSKLQLTCML